MRLAIFICLFLTACSGSEVPSGILPPEKMKVVFFDIVRADEFTNNFIAIDTTANVQQERIKLYEKVFVLHKTSKDEFYDSYKYYQQNPEKHKQLFDSLQTYSTRVRDKQDVQPKLELNSK